MILDWWVKSMTYTLLMMISSFTLDIKRNMRIWLQKSFNQNKMTPIDNEIIPLVKSISNHRVKTTTEKYILIHKLKETHFRLISLQDTLRKNINEIVLIVSLKNISFSIWTFILKSIHQSQLHYFEWVNPDRLNSQSTAYFYFIIYSLLLIFFSSSFQFSFFLKNSKEKIQ